MLFLPYRDCIRLAFMDVLQKELDVTAQSWNNHVIRLSQGGISGTPEELYSIPALHGILFCIIALYLTKVMNI